VSKALALIAHDGKKDEMVELVRSCLGAVGAERLVATDTTGRVIEEHFPFEVERLASGPHGGDLQIGARVASGDVKMVIFLRDPLTAHPHDPDIQALMKVCDVYHVPLATNSATARLCLLALHSERQVSLAVR
jgi:methylglyoxal synthase